MARKQSRRAHNTGAVYYSDSHKRWEGSISLGYIAGSDGKLRRKRVTRTGKTEQEVVDKLDRLKLSMHDGTYRPDKAPRLADYLRQWLEGNTESRWRPKTLQAYAYAVEIIVPALGHFRLDQLHNTHVEALLNDLAATHSRNTITNVRAVLRAALNDAIRRDMVTRNAASEARMPRHVTKESIEANPLTQEQMVHLLDTVAGTRYEHVFTVAVMLGLRIGEIRGLRWRDVDFPNAQLTVRHQVQTIDNKPVLTTPKSKTSRRTIPLPNDVVSALRQQRKTQLEDRLLAGKRWQDLDYVFASTVGTPVDEANLRKALREACDAANLDRRRFHDLRHSCGSFLASTGVQPKELQRILGHENFETTMKHYIHAYTTSMETAMKAWDRLRPEPIKEESDDSGLSTG